MLRPIFLQDQNDMTKLQTRARHRNRRASSLPIETAATSWLGPKSLHTHLFARRGSASSRIHQSGRRRPVTKRIWVETIARSPEGERRILVQFQTAKTLIALVNAGACGITALEIANRAYRLAAYCQVPRTQSGLAIRTERAGHPGGSRGRHVLDTPVTIRFVADSEQQAEAK